jgi:hypothetical protein
MEERQNKKNTRKIYDKKPEVKEREKKKEFTSSM